MNLKLLKKGFYWCGIVDKNLDVFDIVMLTKYGSSYNSYILETSDGLVLFENVKMYKGKKQPSFDTYLEHIKSITDDLRNIKYIVVNHTEPDHSGSIKDLLKYCNRNCKIICSYVAAEYLEEIFNKKLPIQKVSDKQEIKIGNKTLKFFDIPMLHWPDSMFTLIKEDKIAVTCDTLGAHYGTKSLLVSKMTDKEFKSDYTQAFIHYYNTIMSPFKPFVMMAMNKLEELYNENKIDMIATGHGPIIDVKSKIKWAIAKYKTLSTVKNPYQKPLLLFVTCSAYNYTQKIAELIIKYIDKKYKNEFEIKKYKIDVKTYPKQKPKILDDLKYAKALFVGTPTLNNDSLPIVWDFLSYAMPLECANKYACCFGSYGWSGEATKNITQRLKQLKFKTVKALSFRFQCSEFDINKINDYTENFIEYIKTRKVLDQNFIYKNESWGEAEWK